MSFLCVFQIQLFIAIALENVLDKEFGFGTLN